MIASQERCRILIYLDIAKKITEEIKSGEFAEGSRLPGVRDLAAAWNTSANTVLRALDELESSGLIRKTRGQGIFVSSGIGKEQSATELPILEFEAWSLDAPFNRLLLSSVEKAASENSFRLIVKGSEKMTSDSMSPGRIVIPEAVSGDFRHYCKDVPTVYIGEFNTAPDFKGSYISVDTCGGFRNAAEMLLESGREIIAYIGATSRIEYEPGWHAIREVLSGAPAGFRSEYTVTAGGWDADLGRAAMKKLLFDGEYPDAVICCNDSLAAGVYQACREAGLTIPDDIAVIGAGNQDIAPLLDPPLTSLKYPAAVMGNMAVNYIKAVESGLIGRAELLRARLDMDLVVRGSAPAAESSAAGDLPVDDEAWL